MREFIEFVAEYVLLVVLAAHVITSIARLF